MTGFGRAESNLPDKKITVEIKSLNSKQADINARMPLIYREKELEIRQMVSSRLERGKIDISINIDMIREEPSSEINKPLVISYYNQLKEIADELQLESSDVLLSSVLRMPETIKAAKNELGEEEWLVLTDTIKRALDELELFRAREGQSLEEDLRLRTRLIMEKLESVNQFEDERIKRIRDRIDNSLATFLDKEVVDNNRLEQELIYYLEKLDINEEKVRLKHHCGYFIDTFVEDSPGKKLGFISQEMGREINTLGSKANQADIQKLVVEMKDELEKIKEQVLNIL